VRRIVVALVLLAACGSSDDGPLADVQRSLEDVRAGTMFLELGATTEGSDPVGFSVEGPFDLDAGGEVPELDLRYTRLLAGEEQVVRVRSDGERVTVEEDGETTEVPPSRVGALRLEDGPAGFDDFDLEAWIRDPVTEEDGGTATITGELVVPRMLQDLIRIAAETAGVDPGDGLSDDDADALADRIRSSSITVVADGERFRSLDAQVAFGREVPSRLRRALGPYAGAALRLRLRLD
jgi:hypothetical protein